MNCPECNGDTQVLDSRFYWRRRKCLKCNHRFNTIELVTKLGFKGVLKENSNKHDVPPEQIVVEQKVQSIRTEKPKNKVQTITLSAVKRNSEARRRVEDLLESRRLDSLNDSFLDPDFDYLPEKW